MDVKNDKMPCNNHDVLSDTKRSDYTTIETNSGDITFCISSYVKEAIKVIIIKNFMNFLKIL